MDTDSNPGQCKTSDFNNKLFSIKQGKKQVCGLCQSLVLILMVQIIQTAEQELPWVQLDLGAHYDVVEVCRIENFYCQIS